ncbi:putative ribonuclease H-like domain-containing protein, partial [Tanacetum coccineum]
MELENSQNNALAKLPILKLGEYEMWEIRIKQYFQIQDYALWEVIENGNSWVPIPVTAPESGPSTALKMTVPSTTEEKICKKNDLLKRFGGNDATKKTQKALLKQQYENFNATSSESLDSIFNRLQKLVSRLAILGVDTPPEDLNVKFLRSLPSEWDTHVVVWMNKPDFETMGLDDLYNNFKIVEQKVKRTVAAYNADKNLAFLTTSSSSSTNSINTVNTGVSTGNTKVNTASTETSTASFSDATVYAFLSTQPQGSQLVHEDLEQLHDDDLEEMDLKWNMALLSMRARKFYQRTGRKIIIDGSSTAGYDKSKVECFNCHKMGHFARECRAPRSKDNRNWNQGSSSKAVRIEDASEKAMCAIDGAGFDWSDMAEDEIQANMALMAFTDSEVSNDKSCLQNYEALKKQYDDLLVKLDDTAFKAATYKRGLSILEAQVVKYKESKVLFSEEIALLKRSVGHKDYLMGLVKTELEKVKEEKEGFEFKLAKFEKSSKDLDDLLASQVTDKSKRGFGYTAVPSPHPLILNRPTPLDLSYSGLEEFKQPEVNEYGPRDSSLKPTTVCDRESNNSKENTDDSLTQQPKTVTKTSSVVSSLNVDKDWKEKFFHPANHVRVEEPKKARENTDAPIIEDWVSDDEEEVESIPKEEKKADVPTATKKESVKTVKPSRRTVRYAEMYRSQRPRGNQRSWNGQKSDQLGCNFVFQNKACFICGNFDHIQYNCPNAYKHMVPRAVLMRTGLKTVKNAKPLSTVRSVNTVRPFSTARFVNTVRSYNTAHPKPTVSCARPKTHFQNQAQRPFYKNTTLTKRSNIQNINTAKQAVNTVRPNVNTVRARGFNASNSQLNEKGFVDSGCSRHMSGNIAHLSDFKEFDGGYVTFGGGANGGRITGKGTIKTDKLDFEDVYFVKELKFNLFSVSQMCDKKNYVLFTDSECLVLSPNFKLPDESQVLLKIPRQNNMYSFDMKNIVPKDGLTCLVAKATSEESMLWHRRLGHVNFKNINKLVKDNLVRDLPLKRFENDQTCVACLKGKQHRASCKTKAFCPSTKPLFMLHMDLFGPTFVSSLMHKKYCLVVTDDFSRFSWVFFLSTKDETSEILKNFIKEIENLVDKKVKIIRSDNGTEFKNHVMDEFCREKGIKREYSVARTPQQNGVAERKNRTLIEAARTMLADSKLPTTFWAEAVSTACYVQNRVLVVKPHNKTPYELFRGIKPAIGFMKPFGCHVTILNTLDKLGKFDGKSDEGFFVGYSLSSKAFRVYNIRTRKVQENLHVGFLENKPMLEGNGPKWLFDLDSLTQSMNYVPVVAGSISNVSAGIQGASESIISSQQDQDCIFMPIWKDASYFEDDSLKSVNDAQLQDQDGIHDECTFQDDGIDDHQVNTASPQVCTGSGEISTADYVNTCYFCGLMGAILQLKTHKWSDPAWVEAMQEELLQFKLQNVWVLVDLPKGHRAIVFAPVAWIEAIRNISGVCLLYGFHGLQMGSQSAFLYGQQCRGSVWPLVKDSDDEMLMTFYRSMIRSLMYLIASRPDIMFAVCACARFQVSLKTSHLLAVKRIFRYLKGKPSLGIWYSKDSPLELGAYTDSDYAGATLDRKSTTGGCQFLGNRENSEPHSIESMPHVSKTEKRDCGEVILIKSYNFGSFCMLYLARVEKHNMVAFLEKSTGSAGFHQIIDFIHRSHICYALTKKPEVCVSFIKQFWRTAEILTDENGNVKIHATIDGHSLSITEGSLRRHLKLDDQDGITSLPTTEIFAQLALMGYATDSDKLTFQKGAFSPQWRFLIHNILHCLSPKKTAWEQFSSNIAAAVICLATNRKFNFSRMIFDHMVSNISSPHKFLMYPRFIQLCLDMQRHKLQQHTRFYYVPSLTMKVFSNMKRSTKRFLGQEVALFPNMLDATKPSPSPSRITSSPSPTPTPSPAPSPLQPSPTQPTPTQPIPTQPTPTQPSPTQLSPTQPGTEYHLPIPHDS